MNPIKFIKALICFGTLCAGRSNSLPTAPIKRVNESIPLGYQNLVPYGSERTLIEMLTDMFDTDYQTAGMTLEAFLDEHWDGNWEFDIDYLNELGYRIPVSVDGYYAFGILGCEHLKSFGTDYQNNAVYGLTDGFEPLEPVASVSSKWYPEEQKILIDRSGIIVSKNPIIQMYSGKTLGFSAVTWSEILKTAKVQFYVSADWTYIDYVAPSVVNISANGIKVSDLYVGYADKKPYTDADLLKVFNAVDSGGRNCSLIYIRKPETEGADLIVQTSPVTLEASDSLGRSAQAQFTLKVVEKLKPIFVAVDSEQNASLLVNPKQKLSKTDLQTVLKLTVLSKLGIVSDIDVFADTYLTNPAVPGIYQISYSYVQNGVTVSNQSLAVKVAAEIPFTENPKGLTEKVSDWFNSQFSAFGNWIKQKWDQFVEWLKKTFKI